MQRDLSQPNPMSTQDCDLRGLEWMPLDVLNLLDSTLFLESTGDEFKAAMALICKSWRQVPAGSLPASDNALATLSMARDWTSVRTMALRNWVLCSDGRYYHPIVSAKAMEALPMRQEFVEKRTGENLRKERERKDRKDLFAKLRGKGFVLPHTTKTTELRVKWAELEAAERDARGAVVTPPVTDLSRDLSRLGQGQHSTAPDLLPSIPKVDSGPSAGAEDDAPPDGKGKPFDLTPDDPVTGEAVPARQDLPACPHLVLLQLWNEILPELPQHDPDEWGGQRADNLRARWREKAAKLKWPDQAKGLTYFRRLFTWIRESDWLMGRVPPTPGRRLFQLELQWLVRPNNWPNVMEGKYHEDKEKN